MEDIIINYDTAQTVITHKMFDGSIGDISFTIFANWTDGDGYWEVDSIDFSQEVDDSITDRVREDFLNYCNGI